MMEAVDLKYRVQLHNQEIDVRLPLLIGVLGDFRGISDEYPPPLDKRNFLVIDANNIDDRIKALRPRVFFRLPLPLSGDELVAVDLTFECLGDFLPARVALRVEPLDRLLRLRESFYTLLSYASGNQEAITLIQTCLNDRSLLGNQASPPLIEDKSTSGISGATAAADIMETIRTLVNFLSSAGARADDPLSLLQHLIDELDQVLSQNIEPILHHPNFLEMERAWRGLDHLVRHAAGETIRIRFFSATKNELMNDLIYSEKNFLNKICNSEIEVFGGEPYGLMIVDFPLSHVANDVALLEVLARVGERSAMPVLIGAPSELLYCEDFGHLTGKSRLRQLFRLDDYAAWRKLRAKSEARYLGFVLPHVLGRPLHLDPGMLPNGFRYQENPKRWQDWPWINAAYVVGGRLGQAHARCGWLATVADPAEPVENLPTRDFMREDGSLNICCSVEVALSDRMAEELASLGLITLLHRANTDSAYFPFFPSLYASRAKTNSLSPESVDFQIALVVCHISRYLACISRDCIGRFRTTDDLISYLNDWLDEYVLPEGEEVDLSLRSQKPLRQGWVEKTGPDRHGDHWLRAWLQPVYQMKQTLPMNRVCVPFKLDIKSSH